MQERLNKLLQEVIVDVEKCFSKKIDYIIPQVNICKSISYIALCEKVGAFAYRIHFSKYYESDTNEGIKNHLMHEVIHSLGIHNHGVEFKRRMKQVNAFSGLSQIYNVNTRSKDMKLYERAVAMKNAANKQGNPIQMVKIGCGCGCEWEKKSTSKYVKKCNTYRCRIHKLPLKVL